MPRATADRLIRSRGRRTTVTLPDGDDVIIRGLTRAEIVGLNDCETLSEKEATILAAGLVDPPLTVEQARAWQAEEGSFEPIEAITEAISVASGMEGGAGKAAAKRPARRR